MSLMPSKASSWLLLINFLMASCSFLTVKGPHCLCSLQLCMKRKHVAATRTSLLKVENLSNGLIFKPLDNATIFDLLRSSSWLSSYSAVSYWFSGKSSLRSQLGPFYQSWEFLTNSLALIPHETKSAGFSALPTCFQFSTDVASWMSPILCTTGNFLLLA